MHDMFWSELQEANGMSKKPSATFKTFSWTELPPRPSLGSTSVVCGSISRSLRAHVFETLIGPIMKASLL